MFKHVAHFSMLCFSLFLVVIFYLSNCNNAFGQTLCFNLSIVTFSPVYPPHLSLYDHLKTFFNDPYLAFHPPLLLSIHLFFCTNSPSAIQRGEKCLCPQRPISIRPRGSTIVCLSHTVGLSVSAFKGTIENRVVRNLCPLILITSLSTNYR